MTELHVYNDEFVTGIGTRNAPTCTNCVGAVRERDSCILLRTEVAQIIVVMYVLELVI